DGQGPPACLLVLSQAKAWAYDCPGGAHQGAPPCCQMRLNTSIAFCSDRYCLINGTIFVSRASISCDRFSTSAARSFGTTTTPSSPATTMSPGEIVKIGRA